MAFAAYGMVVIAGPILGPVLGGWITDNASWQWCFLINVPVGMLSLVLVHVFVDEPAALVRERKKRLEGGLKMDVIGFVLVALFFSCLEITLDRGQEDDWFGSSTIVATTVITVVSLILFIPWELTRKSPIVPIRMLGNRNFGLASVLLLLTGVIILARPCSFLSCCSRSSITRRRMPASRSRRAASPPSSPCPSADC